MLPSILTVAKTLAAKGAPAGAISSNVMTLTKGVAKAMFWTKVQMTAAVVAATVVVGAGVPGSMKVMAADSSAANGPAPDMNAGGMVTVPTVEVIHTFRTSDEGMPKSFTIGRGFEVIGDYLYVSTGGERLGGGIIQYFKWDPQASSNKITYVGSVSNSTLTVGLLQ